MDRERSGITWAEFSTHLYSNFYAYQYATGISAAHQLGPASMPTPRAPGHVTCNFSRKAAGSTRSTP